MVLSNRKLKQKLREELEARHVTNNQDSPKTMKELLDSATQKPRLTMREKKRKNPPLIYLNNEIQDDHIEIVSNKKRKKERREKKGSEVKGELEVVVVEDVENGGKKEKLSDKGVKEGVKGGGEVSSEGKVEVLSNKERKKKKMLMKKKNLKKKQKKIEKKEMQQKVEVQIDGSSEQFGQEISKGNDGDAKKVYVGGMPYYSTEEDIRSYFYQCGSITDIDCMMFPETGKFRGIAILTFETEEAAKSALELDGSEMGGLYLKIQPYKTTRTTKTSDFCPPVIEGYNRIYAGNLSWDITEDDLRKFFSDCDISSIRFGEDKETGDFKGYAHVDFADNDSLNKALKLDQKFVCGRPVKISRAVPKKGGVRNTTAASTAVKPEIKCEVNTVVKPENEDDSEVITVAAAPVNTSGVSSRKVKRRTCYDCGERGHLSSDCPKKKSDSAGENPSTG